MQKDKDSTDKIIDSSGELWDKMIQEVKDYAFILLDREGNIVNWNAGAETIKKYSKAEAVGRSFRMFYPPEDQQKKLPEELLEKASREGRAVHEGWRVRKDGSMFWGSIVMTALHDDSGNIIGYSKVTRDLTEKKQGEDMLRQKNKELERINQELASFAYVASHDLQEPLRKIQTFASRILEMEKDKFSERTQDYFGRMQNAAMRMQTLIDDLLTYSRTTTAQKTFEQVDLNEILSQIKHDFEGTISEKKATIIVSTLPVIIGIKFQCHQLFQNLVSNALKFSKTNVAPMIEIKSDLVSGREMKNVPASPTISYHHIVVEDNGIGFEAEYREKIFEVFQRLHGKAEYSGTGIGLSICRKIMENHQGFVTAESVAGIGSKFHIYFPVSVQ